MRIDQTLKRIVTGMRARFRAAAAMALCFGLGIGQSLVAHEGQGDAVVLAADTLPLSRPAAAERNETWQEARDRIAKVIRRFGDGRSSTKVLKALEEVTGPQELNAALEPLVWLRVSVNPESRVKINAVGSRFPVNGAALREHTPRRFLVHIENTAGITAPLNLSAIDVATDPPEAATWCTLEVVDSPFTSRYLTGAASEYKVVQITPAVTGLREVRIVGDAGQGTQDLGFRATADVLLDIKPKP